MAAAEMALSADSQGPMGFSLALMTTEPGGKAWKTRLRGTTLPAGVAAACCMAAQARLPSVRMGSEAARPARRRKERREEAEDEVKGEAFMRENPFECGIGTGAMGCSLSGD